MKYGRNYDHASTGSGLCTCATCERARGRKRWVHNAHRNYDQASPATERCACAVCVLAREKGFLHVALELYDDQRFLTTMARGDAPFVALTYHDSWRWRFRSSGAGGFANACRALAEGIAAARAISPKKDR